MKKIGFVTPWYGDNIPGGAEMELRGLVKHLDENGLDLEIITTCVEKFGSDWNVNYYSEGIEKVNGILVRRFKVRKRNTKKFDQINFKFMSNMPVSSEEEKIYLKEMVNSPDLYQYIERAYEDYSLFVFIPYMFGTTYYGCERCFDKAVMIPCLHDESYAYMEHFKERYSKINGMIFHSKEECELAKKVYNLSNVKNAVLGEGVYTDISFNADNFRKKYNINEPFIIYAGRKESGKNVDTLVKYFDLYKKRNLTDLKLVLIGGGHIDIPGRLQSEIIDLGFVPIQDKYDAYAASELLCNPSRFESFSLIIMESWLCHKPVLVFGDCKVTKGFVSESNGGLYFYNYCEFEECLTYLLNHKEIAKQMGENGRKYVLDNFSWPVIVEKYTNFFTKCIE